MFGSVSWPVRHWLKCAEKPWCFNFSKCCFKAANPIDSTLSNTPKNCQGLPPTLYFSKGQGIQKHCLLQPPKGVHLLVAEGNSLHQPPIGPLNSFQTSLDLLNSSQSKLRVQKGPWPISEHAEECCISAPRQRHTVKHLKPAPDMEWLNFTSTLSPQKHTFWKSI